MGQPTLKTFSDHEVAVGLRCGKANNRTPTSFARLDPVFARDCSGRSVVFFIKEESTRLATSSPFSKRPDGKDPPREKPLLPPTRTPLQTTSTASTGPASTLIRSPTCLGLCLPSGSGRRSDTARRASGDTTSSSLISWMLFASIFGKIAPLVKAEPAHNPCSFRAQLEQFSCDYAKERRSHDARNRGFGLASCSRGLVFLRGTVQVQRAEDWFSQKETLKTKTPNEATDGLAPSVLDSLAVACERLHTSFRQRLKRTRGEKPRVRTSTMLPRPGIPARGYYRPNDRRAGVPRRGHCRPKCRTRLPTGWHRRFCGRS